jgi:D-alanyl-D-alanine carboxypeptidase
MIKKLFLIILSATFLTGCSSSYGTYLNYNEVNNSNIDKEQITKVKVADFFANELCVIPDELNHMKSSNITATSALILNSTKDELIFANNIYQRLYPASLTKLITALVVFRNADLSEVVTVSKNAANITESGAKLCGFKEGDKITLETLLNSLLVYSGNDAGIAIAEHVGGSEEGFAKMMNETVKEIGAVHSNFVNAHGLHNDNQYTTAYDLYLVFQELLNYEGFTSIINQVSYTAAYKNAANQTISKEYLNTNRYLKGTEDAPDGVSVIGGKTGTTSKAGNCLVLYSKDANNDSYISVILQADSGNSLFDQMTSLLEMIK